MARELAHQMGTPLSSLAGWVEVLALPDEERRQLAPDGKLAEAIESDVERLERVSRRFELIGRPPTLQQVSVAQVIQELERYLRPRLPRLGAGVELRVRVRSGLPPVWGNAVLLAWALENLVKNALDALAGRGGHITITVRRARENAIRILVADDGPGIAPEVQGRIFQAGVSTKKSGWGVGLSLTKRIIHELHGGSIVVHARAAGGTAFEIRLPTAEARLRKRRWLSRR
jgi:signal transduction histidine kinase